MAKINTQQLKLEVERQIGKIRAYRRAADTFAIAAVTTAKFHFLEQFDNDPITQELQAGPQAPGSSVLPGGYGNLFSYIGFYEDDKPIDELRAYLARNIRLLPNPTILPYKYIYTVTMPELGELAEVTPMPFGTSKSWVLALEKGLPGFNRYLFDLQRDFAASRSGPAIQTDKKHVMRNASVGAKPYMSKLFNEFRRTLLSL